MKKSPSNMTKFLLTGLIVSALLCTPALAIDLKFSGQINQMVMVADDDHKTDIFIADNDNSSSRLRLKGEQVMNDIFTVGALIEIEGQRNASNTLFIDQGNDGAFDWNDRWIEVYFTTPYGQIELGKGDGAANNTAEVDLSGTSVIMMSRTNATSEAMIWKNSDGTPYRGGLTIGDTRNNFDGLSRNDRLRYNSPEFFGVKLAASITNGKAYEFAAFYSMDLFGKFVAAMGYVDTQDRGSREFSQISMSASWLADFGLNATVALGRRDYNNSSTDSNNLYLKVGYKWDIHALALEYGMTTELDLKNDTSANVGLAYVITPWKNVDFYASMRHFWLDAGSGGDPDAIQQLMAGTRIKF